MDNDILHEEDHESEDYDFQCDEFKTQHFKKQGWLSPWVLCGGLVFFYFWLEYMYSHYPDDEYWRKKYPVTPNDTTSTIDLNMHEALLNPQYRKMVDSEIEEVPRFRYDGDRLYYGRFAGANQPHLYHLEDRDKP